MTVQSQNLPLSGLVHPRDDPLQALLLTRDSREGSKEVTGEHRHDKDRKEEYLGLDVPVYEIPMPEKLESPS